jgi:hypothetical protein
VRKRLVKSPEVYVRDSGLVPALLGIADREALRAQRGLAPKLERGFHEACDAVRPQQRRVVSGGVERFPLADGAEAISLRDLCEELAAA